MKPSIPLRTLALVALIWNGPAVVLAPGAAAAQESPNVAPIVKSVAQQRATWTEGCLAGRHVKDALTTARARAAEQLAAEAQTRHPR